MKPFQMIQIQQLKLFVIFLVVLEDITSLEHEGQIISKMDEKTYDITWNRIKDNTKEKFLFHYEYTHISIKNVDTTNIRGTKDISKIECGYVVNQPSLKFVKFDKNTSKMISRDGKQG